MDIFCNLLNGGLLNFQGFSVEGERRPMQYVVF